MSDNFKFFIMVVAMIFSIVMFMAWFFENGFAQQGSTYIHCERFADKTICIYPWNGVTK